MMEEAYQAHESFKRGDGGGVSDIFPRWFTIGTHGLQQAISGLPSFFLKELIQPLDTGTTDGMIGSHHRCHITDSWRLTNALAVIHVVYHIK